MKNLHYKSISIFLTYYSTTIHPSYLCWLILFSWKETVIHYSWPLNIDNFCITCIFFKFITIIHSYFLYEFIAQRPTNSDRKRSKILPYNKFVVEKKCQKTFIYFRSFQNLCPNLTWTLNEDYTLLHCSSLTGRHFFFLSRNTIHIQEVIIRNILLYQQ